MAQEIVRSTEERLDHWNTLKGIAGLRGRVDPNAIAQQVRSETAQKLASGLMAMLTGDGSAAQLLDLPAAPAASPAEGGDGEPAPAASPVWSAHGNAASSGKW